jgi:hypothetical protein
MSAGPVLSTTWGSCRRRPYPRNRQKCANRAQLDSATIVVAVEENRARRVVDALRERGVDAHVAKAGVYQFGITIALGDGREAVWDTDGTAGLEAQVMRDGMLVGFVPEIEGSEDFDEAATIEAILRTDYNAPVATRRASTPAPAAPLPVAGGVFRRFLDGFRYKD